MPHSPTLSAASNATIVPWVGDRANRRSLSEREKRNAHMIDRIHVMIRLNDLLHPHAQDIQVSFTEVAIELRGQLPTDDLKNRLLPIVRQAGVLCRVDNNIQVG